MIVLVDYARLKYALAEYRLYLFLDNIRVKITFTVVSWATPPRSKFLWRPCGRSKTENPPIYVAQ